MDINSAIFSIIDHEKLDEIQMKDTIYAIEKKYQGTYTDLGNKEESEIISLLKESDWRDVVHAKFSNTNNWLYRIITDNGRSAFLNLIDIKENGNYLDVGSGWGQVTLPLGKMGNAFALDLTEQRLSILREIARQEGLKYINYLQGNFLTFPFKDNSFDLVIFNGSLEWIGIGRNSGESIQSIQSEALKKVASILKPDGQVYIGIENSIGLKYIMGSMDDHTGISYISFLDEKKAQQKYQEIKKDRLPAKTWSLTEYIDLLNNAGLEIVNIYACFPDYKLIRQMINIKNINNFILNSSNTFKEYNGIDGQELEFNNILNDLYKVFARNNIMQHFVPSYGIIAKKRR
jgi:ubiquinone/menaquinone biosynthesis C-methylase UbiE